MAINDRTVAILVGEGTAAEELNPIQQALVDAGAEVILVGTSLEALETFVLSKDVIITVGLGIEVAKQIWFDAVVIPGGAGMSGYIGLEAVFDFLGEFDTSGKVIAAIGDGVRLLVDAELVDGRRVAAPEALRELVENAGGEVAPCPFTLDRPLYTACGAEGVGALTDALITALEHVHLPAKALANPIID
jgi:putative intracellular protease/amidase